MAELSPYDEYLIATKHHEKLRLSREERDHIAGHALDSIRALAQALAWSIGDHGIAQGVGSNCSRKIAALSNLLGDIGLCRASGHFTDGRHKQLEKWYVGQLFPAAQLRPWLEEWQHQDAQALLEVERARSALHREGYGDGGGGLIEADILRDIEATQTKLGTGAILLARIEKWMASHGN